MDVAHQGGNEQAALWNGAAGCAWVEAQATLDQIMEPIERLLTEEVAALSPRLVLDVGCGTGATTLAVARRLGAQAECVGVDISEPMIAAARGRAARDGSPATFIRADAQTYPFESSSYDAIMSRFGVMFFDDPVRAFANLRRAARPGSELRFIAWRSPDENPFMTAAERAAAPLLSSIPPFVPDAPGRFAFADAHRVRRILDESGWAGIDVQPIDVPCRMPERELAGYATRFGPLARVIDDVDERTRTRIADAVRTAFEPFVHGADVRWVAACWMVRGRAP
jgi:SAM-dependent methyltransferase